MSNEQRYEVNKPDVVDESVDGEVLIVHLGTGAYYSSRGPGDAAWKLVSAGATASEAASAAQIQSSALSAFLAELLAEDLVRPRTQPEVAPASFQLVAGEPTLEKYTDMQELLLLDPIHDVEEAGWPKARPAAAGD